ncbi:MAG: reverse transcriptase domain-containing protein, partial [Firmicutes bacterium]|nr:reverse transcriptase domain-containing protein [Bacillota bacterium]
MANLFLHYAFDWWMQLYHAHQPFERYADDAVVHCQSLAVAQALKEALAQRFGDCGLTLHPTKTRIVYGQDDHRREAYPGTSFDFLGYTFRSRRSKNRHGEFFMSFAPAASQAALKPRLQTVHGWRIPLQVGRTLAELARDYHPIRANLSCGIALIPPFSRSFMQMPFPPLWGLPVSEIHPTFD